MLTVSKISHKILNFLNSINLDHSGYHIHMDIDNKYMHFDVFGCSNEITMLHIKILNKRYISCSIYLFDNEDNEIYRTYFYINPFVYVYIYDKKYNEFKLVLTKTSLNNSLSIKLRKPPNQLQ